MTLHTIPPSITKFPLFFKCHVAFIFSFAESNNDLVRVCIDVSHLGNLQGFLSLILLIDTNSVDPYPAWLTVPVNTLKTSIQCGRDLKAIAIADTFFQRGKSAPGVRQHFVLRPIIHREGFEGELNLRMDFFNFETARIVWSYG